MVKGAVPKTAFDAFALPQGNACQYTLAHVQLIRVNILEYTRKKVDMFQASILRFRLLPAKSQVVFIRQVEVLFVACHRFLLGADQTFDQRFIRRDKDRFLCGVCDKSRFGPRWFMHMLDERVIDWYVA